MLIKICGTTSIEDAQLAARAGATCIGLVMHPGSPRHVSRERAREIAASVALPVVVVSVNQPLGWLLESADELQPHALQLHGDESPTLVRELSSRGLEIWKVLSGEAATWSARARVYADAGAQVLVLDARVQNADETIYGGTGHTVDWDAARALSENGFRVMLAGGLSPANVERALEIARPWGVDVVSGVEARKGIKDAHKLRAFVENAQRGEL